MSGQLAGSELSESVIRYIGFPSPPRLLEHRDLPHGNRTSPKTKKFNANSLGGSHLQIGSLRREHG